MNARRPLSEPSSQRPSRTFSTRTIWPQTDAQSQSAGPEASEAVAMTEPLKVFMRNSLGPHVGAPRIPDRGARTGCPYST